MKVIVKARHMNLTPALKAHAEEKLGQSIMRIFDRPALKIEIELSDNGEKPDNMVCRATLTMPKGKTINITESADDMYKAIDLAQDRLRNQVKRQRNRKKDTARTQKEAERAREQTARSNLTSAPEAWEAEVQEYERSTSAV